MTISEENRNAFTLIELLVVIAIIAILSIVVVLSLNPAEMLRQSRDSNRSSDLDTLTHALNLYQTDQSVVSGSGPLGSSTLIYLSLPDSSSTCGSWNLPAAPSGYSYQCAPTSSYRNTNGSGWIPVNLASTTTGSPLGQLPIDPVNASSSGLYYAYTTNGIQYEVTSLFESSKYKAQSAQNPSISSYPEVNAKGSSLTLNPLFNPSGLVGYWPMDEGSGNIAYDESGIGNKATFGCLGTSCSNPSWAGGRIGSFALSESPGASQSSYAKASPVNNPASSGSVLSISLWIDPNSSQSDGGVFIRNGNGGDENYGFELNSQSGGLYSVRLEAYSGSFVSATSNHIVPTSVWSNLVLIFTQGQNFQIYLNGVFQQTVSFPYVSVLSTSDLGLGGTDGTYQSLDGLIDDVRIYSRALSAAEISALYNAEK